jgi:autotransporter-associated beta strand protein
MRLADYRHTLLSSVARFAGPFCAALLASQVAAAQNVPIDPAFASNPAPYDSTGTDVLYGVQDITVIRQINGTPDMQINPEGYTITFSGEFSGNNTYIPGATNLPTLTLVGSGTAIFTGGFVNGGQDGVVISGGTLQIGNGGAAQPFNPIYITDNSDLVFDQTGTTTINNYLTGSGTMEIEAGTVVMNAANYQVPSYSGLATIDSGSTLEIYGSAPAATLTGNFNDNGSIVAGEYAIALTGDISGTGNFVVNNGATVTLEGNNTYSGGTIVNGTLNVEGPTTYSNITIGTGGELIVGTDGTSGSVAGNITNNGQIVFNRYDTYTYGGVISGTGSLIQQTAGTLILTGNNTYTGANGGTVYNSEVYGTTVNNGTLQLGNGGTSGSIVTNVYLNGGALTFDHSNTYFTGGDISGAGSINQIGTGTTILGGVLSYTGTTTISAGGLQIGGYGASSFLSGNVVDNGTLVLSGVTISGPISGTGFVEVLGDAILAGNNTYTDGTTIDTSGTLQVGNGGTSGSLVGNVADNGDGTLVFDNSGTSTYAGVISGSGEMIQASTGTLILTGANTYTGPTVVFSGTLQLGNGGTTGSIAGNVEDYGILAFDHSDTVVFGGQITGSGGLTQAGSGLLVLNNANTYTGTTTVASGSLEVGDASHASATVGGDVVVDSGTLLEGYGTIAGRVTNNGTVMPGDAIGTLTVGSYAQGAGGTLAIEVSPAAYSKLEVAGAASLGGTLKLTFDPGTYHATVDPIVNAGSLTGTFSNIVTSGAPAGLAVGVQYTATAVDLVIQPPRANELYGDFIANSLDNAETFNELIFTHLDTEYCNGLGSIDDRAGEKSCPEVSMWRQVVGGMNSTDASGDLTGYNSQWGGVIVGLEVHSDLGFSVGGTAAYARNYLSVDGNSGNIVDNSFLLSVNGGMPVLFGRIDLNGMWMSNSGQATRSLVPDGVDATASSSPHTMVYSGAAQYSQSLWSPDLMGLVRMTYANAQMQSLFEASGAPVALNVNSNNTSDFYGDLGLRASHVFHLQSGTMVVPEVSGGVRAIFGSTGRAAEESFAGGSSFEAPGIGASRVAFVGSFGVTGQRHEDFSLFLRADGRIDGKERVGVISIGELVNF